MLALAQPATHLTIQPWTGGDLQTTTSAAAKYRLAVVGKPKASLHLQASGVADGWIAAFCTPKFCAPQHVDTQLPASGQAVFQFELIRESAGAPKTSSAKISVTDGPSITVPTAYRD